MIEKLGIHRFRGIEKGKLENFGNINLLIGPNNSGKTAILEMLYLSLMCGRICRFLSDQLPSETYIECHIAHSTDLLGYNPFSRLCNRHGQSPMWLANPGFVSDDKSLVFRLNSLSEYHPLHDFRLTSPPSKSIETYGGFTSDELPVTPYFSLREIPQDKNKDNEEYKKSDTKKNPYFELIPESLREYVKPPVQITYSWYPPFIFKGIENKQDSFSQLSVWALQGEIPLSSHVLFFDFHAAHNHLNSVFFQSAYTAIPDWNERIAESLSNIYTELANCKVDLLPVELKPGGPQMTGYIRLPGRTPLPVDSFGDGTRHAFKVLASLHALLGENKPSLFLWEDPELFMHPSALRAVLKEVIQLIDKSPTQLFISTHSNEVIAWLTSFAIEKTFPAEKLRAFRLGIKDGELLSARFHSDNLASWLKTGKDPRFWGIADTALNYQLESHDG